MLDQLGGTRTGGPHKAIQKVPSAPDATAQQLLQHMKLSEQQSQQLQRKHSGLLGSSNQPSVSGVTFPPVSRSSSEATMHSSRTSSANSLDSATAAAEGMLPLPLSAELRPLQPTNSAALNSSSIPTGPVSVPEAAAVGSDSFSSEDATAAAGGSGSAGHLGPTKRPDDHLLGYHHVKQWDILWTKSVYAIRAARQLQQGQIVSAIAGLNCLSMKKRMVQTLRMVSVVLTYSCNCIP